MEYLPIAVPRLPPLSSPPSLSCPSLQSVSSLVEQSGPSQPAEHSQRHSPWKFVLHWPLLLHMLGHPSMVQWRPFQPVTQRQGPFLHWPCCSHLTRQGGDPESESLVSLTWRHSPCSDTDCLTSLADRRSSCPGSGRAGRSPGCTALCCSPLQSSRAGTCTPESRAPESRDLHSQGHTGGRQGPAGRTLPPASPSCRHTHRRCSSRGRSTAGQHSPAPHRTLPCIPSYTRTSRPRSVRVRCSPGPRTPRIWCCTPSPSSRACRHTPRPCTPPGRCREEDRRSHCRTPRHSPGDTCTGPAHSRPARHTRQGSQRSAPPCCWSAAPRRGEHRRHCTGTRTSDPPPDTRSPLAALSSAMGNVHQFFS